MRALARREFLGATLAAALPRPAAAQAPQPSKIDIHVHLGRDRQDMEKVTKDNVSEAAKHLVGQMDRYGVEKSLIVPVEPLFPTDVYLEAAKLHPERLLAACSVIPRPAEAAIEKLKSYRDRGAKALKLQPMQYDPRDPAVERVVGEAVRLGLPVLFHHLDTPKSFPDMLSHFASTFPNGYFVVIHFGGVYGFWDVLPLARLPNVYLETSTAFARIVQSPLRTMLHFLVEENRLDRLIFGSELPRDYESVSGAIDALLGPSARPEVRKAIYRGNAERLLKLTVSSRLESDEKERDGWQRTAEIFRAMGVKEGSRVAEVGAGSGYFIGGLARAAGANGRIYAVDIAPGQVQQLRDRIQQDEMDNVEVILGDAKDPKLPSNSLDAVLICDTYHEMTEYHAMLAGIRKALKPGGTLVVVDRVRLGEKKERSRSSRAQQVAEHQIAPELVDQEVRQAGFTAVELRDPFLERGPGGRHLVWMLVAHAPM